MKRFARLPSPAMLVALAALFVALGGVSYGFATGTIDSREVKNNSLRSGDIRNNDIRSIDLRNNEVRGRDIRNSTIRSEDIGTNQVKGVDVLESSLGLVPKANTANTANTAGSASSAGTAGSAGSLSSQDKINYQAGAGSAAQTVYDSGKLKLSATCGAGSTLTLTATTSVDNATIQSSPPAAGTSDTDFDTSDTVTLSGASEQRNVVYSEPGGQVVVVEYAAVAGGAYNGTVGCIVKGLAQKL